MSELKELLFVPREDLEAAILTLWSHVREQDKRIKELEKRLEDYDTQRIDKLAGRLFFLEKQLSISEEGGDE